MFFRVTENSLRNCILLHFLSFFILVIFNASNTLLVRGVYIDAGENVEECVEFPCYYFRLRFQVRCFRDQQMMDDIPSVLVFKGACRMNRFEISFFYKFSSLSFLVIRLCLNFRRNKRNNPYPYGAIFSKEIGNTIHSPLHIF